jgi:hypothetical protein
MKPSAVMPQEANFSLIGRFGNCPLVGRVVRPVIRGPAAGFGAVDGPDYPDGARGTISASGPGGGLHDLLLDEGKVPRQRAGTQHHGDAVGLFQGEIAGDLDRAAGNGLADHRR